MSGSTRRGLSRIVRPRHQRPPRRDRPGRRGLRPGRRGRPRQPAQGAPPRTPSGGWRSSGRPSTPDPPTWRGRVEVATFDGLTVDFCRARGARSIVRGLRAISDFETEIQLAHNNRVLAPDVDSVFFMTSLEQSYVSSSLVKEIATVRRRRLGDGPRRRSRRSGAARPGAPRGSAGYGAPHGRRTVP